jgi:hypothetical protein
MITSARFDLLGKMAFEKMYCNLLNQIINYNYKCVILLKINKNL